MLGSLEVARRRLASAAVGDDFEGDLLAFIQTAHAGLLDGADVNEHILAACFRLNETKTLLGVEPLDDTCLHVNSLLDANVRNHGCNELQAVQSMFWKSRKRLVHLHQKAR